MSDEREIPEIEYKILKKPVDYAVTLFMIIAYALMYLLYYGGLNKAEGYTAFIYSLFVWALIMVATVVAAIVTWR